jgi:uncharacterized protein (DUF427 family)
MSEKTKLIPDASHPITVEPAGEHVVVTAGGKTIADTRAALTLREASYPAVYYIPRADADLSQLEPTDHGSYCPFKGEASYFSVVPAGEQGVNAVWTYEAPHDAVAPIKDHLAFYPDRVEVEVSPA